MNASSFSLRHKKPFALSFIAALMLAACGGGGGGGDRDNTAQPLSAGGQGRIAAAALAAAGEAAVTIPDATVLALTKVSETRVGRTVFDYVFKVTVKNGYDTYTGITAMLTAAGAGTTIVDGSVNVGDLAADGTTTPADTITLRHDRAKPFNLAALQWQVTGTRVLGCELDGTQGGEVVILPGEPGAPEVATGYAPKKVVYSKTYMAITNNPVSTKVACQVLKDGGTAVDAAVAAQMVLNLVEPQSSGIGGGAFIVHYDAATKQIVAYDGRETAPSGATENYLRWKSDTDRTTPSPNAVRSGRSIGTPGTLRVLELAHGDHGKMAWKSLFQPAIKLAANGFAVPPRMAASISSTATVNNIKRDPDMAAYFLNADGTPRKVNTILTNPAFAETLTAVANGGADAFYKDGPIARAIVDKIQTTYDGNTTPGVTTVADMEGYVAKRRTPVCTTYRTYEICGMPPPSSGGIAVAQILGIAENFPLASYAPLSVDDEGGRPHPTGVHIVLEAMHLAYADRNKYVADTDFVGLPGGTWDTMLNKPYLAQRASMISLTQRMPLPAPAGNLGEVPLGPYAGVENGTTHLSLVDKYGNVVSMTTTIESGLGSYHFVRGFLLNNELTDFSAAPADAEGKPIANRVQPLKRPRSSMSPTIVFKRNPDGTRGAFHMTTGTPGGAAIIQYVSKTLVNALDWGMNAQQAVSAIAFGASNGSSVSIGGEHPNVDTSTPPGGLAGGNDPLIVGLRALGHTVTTGAQSSGLSAIIVRPMGSPASNTFEGGADPRREGVVLGDTFKP